MTEWSVEQTRQWIMKTLYETYIEDEQASARWSETVAATESHPGGAELVQECKQLATSGWITILTQAYGYLFAQLTPDGKRTWETFLSAKRGNPLATLPLS